jgi:hypothetical protein
MQVRYVKAHGPYAVGDVRDAGHDEAIHLLEHGIAEPAGGPEVRKATPPVPHGKRNAASKHDGG